MKVDILTEDKHDNGCLVVKEESRFIELPLNVGDVVFAYYNKSLAVQPFEITNITITQNKRRVWTKKYRAMLLIDGKTVDMQINFSFDDIGKEVFLTREEAEKELMDLQGVKCKDCKYLTFSDCYGECGKNMKGIVSPDDSCPLGETRCDNKQ